MQQQKMGVGFQLGNQQRDDSLCQCGLSKELKCWTWGDLSSDL